MKQDNIFGFVFTGILLIGTRFIFIQDMFLLAVFVIQFCTKFIGRFYTYKWILRVDCNKEENERMIFDINMLLTLMLTKTAEMELYNDQ